MGSAHRGGGTPPSEGGVPPGRWEAVGRLPTPSHRPGGTGALLAGGRVSEAFRRSPTSQEGHLPPREVSLPPGGQYPITLEYQIYPPTIDTLETGMSAATSVSFFEFLGNKSELICFPCQIHFLPVVLQSAEKITKYPAPPTPTQI